MGARRVRHRNFGPPLIQIKDAGVHLSTESPHLEEETDHARTSAGGCHFWIDPRHRLACQLRGSFGPRTAAGGQVLQKRPVTLIVGIVLMVIAIALMFATLS